MIFPKIPTRLWVSGNKTVARSLVGLGKKRLSDLATFMKFQKLNTHSNILKLQDGTTIKTTINYDISNVFIHVPLPVIKKPIVSEIKQKDFVYFYQITNIGDDSVIPAYGNLKINRIIIWDIAFDDEGNYDNGNGDVILDVDIHSNTVYPSNNNLTNEEQIALANLYNNTNDITGSLSDYSPPDISGDWFATGPMTDPIEAYEDCGRLADGESSGTCDFVAPEDYAISLSVADVFIGTNSNEWRPMMQGYVEETYLPDWREIWCPCYGGDQLQLYDANKWPLLGQNAEYYPNYEYITQSYAGNLTKTQIGEGICNDNGNLTTYPVYFWWDEYFESDYGKFPVRLKFGAFYTPNLLYDFPTFFVLENYSHLNLITVYHVEMESESGGPGIPGYEGQYDPDGSDCYNYGRMSITFNYNPDDDSLVNTDENTHSISTPLEKIIMMDEMLITGHNGDSGCNDFSCFDIANTVNIYVWADSGGGGEWSQVGDMLPCYMPDNVQQMKKESIIYADDFFSQLRIPDSINLKDNFVALLIHKEFNAKTTSYYYDPDYVTDAWCNNVVVDDTVPFDPSPAYGWGVGVIIYIMSPKSFWTESIDPDTQGTVYENYWDIHSERQSEGKINSNRCLGLEEYINTKLAELKNFVETINGLPMYGDGMLLLKSYMYEFHSGFTYKLKLPKEV